MYWTLFVLVVISKVEERQPQSVILYVPVLFLLYALQPSPIAQSCGIYSGFNNNKKKSNNNNINSYNTPQLQDKEA